MKSLLTLGAFVSALAMPAAAFASIIGGQSSHLYPGYAFLAFVAFTAVLIFIGDYGNQYPSSRYHVATDSEPGATPPAKRWKIDVTSGASRRKTHVRS